ncbi:MAG: response regulator [bacterium]|nr:response regulator [bacterium]
MIPKQILDDRAIRVLLIACDEADHALVTRLSDDFEYSNHTVDWASSYDSGLEAISAEDHDIYLVDSDLGDQTGLELIAATRSDDQPAPFVLLTQAANHDMDIEALDLGTADFIVKDRLDADRLERSIRHALVHIQNRYELVAAKDEADAATTAKTKFLANVSHDIRTPLNAIIGMTEIVLRDDLHPNQREALETVLVASESLMDLADRLVNVAGIESGKIDLDPAPFNVRDCIADVVRIFGLRAEQQNIEVSVDVPLTVPDLVVGDGPRLQQVLIDLLSNAVKFTERGHISIRVDDLIPDDDGAMLCIEIEDTGAGIPADLQSSLFDLSEKATTSSKGASGLGIVSKIVTAMGGEVSLESKLGKGSTFTFTVRVEPADQTAGEPADGQQPVILVMASSPDDRRNLETDLASGGFDPLMVGDIGAAANAAAAAGQSESSLDAIVLDTAYKPFEMAQSLNELAGGNTPVTLMVPAGREGDERRCREAGVRGYVEKPADHGVLVDVVKATITATKAGGVDTVVTADTLGASRPTMNILVVDDVETNLILTVRMLTERGHHAVAVRNGVEAIDVFEQSRFDAVLMDLQMPGLDGFDTTAAMRAEEVLRGIARTPIVALTGHTTAEERENCIAAGMDGFLSKPVRPDALFAAVEQFAVLVTAAA